METSQKAFSPFPANGCRNYLSDPPAPDEIRDNTLSLVPSDCDMIKYACKADAGERATF
jgi:hypothetical protein